MNRNTHRSIRRLAFLLGGVALLATAGCSNGRTSNTSPGLAGDTAKAHSYVGTQSQQWTTDLGLDCTVCGWNYGGVWNLSVDDGNNAYSYANIDFNDSYYITDDDPKQETQIVSSGTIAASAPFKVFTPYSGGSAGSDGYAIEVPGETLILRPRIYTNTGQDAVAVIPDTMPPVIGVDNTACRKLAAPTTYQFISLGSDDTDSSAKYDGASLVNSAAWGSVQASTSGIDWTFSNLKMYAFDGTDLKPTALPAGACGATQEGYAIAIARATATNNLPVTAQVSPSGYFIMSQGQGSAGSWGFPPTTTGPYGLVGVVQPSSQLSTSSLVAAKYAGFEYNPMWDQLEISGTLPVLFSGGAGTTLTGGAYPNDDITQTPASDVTIDLGTQDSSNNGLYKSVTVTVPDTYKGCMKQSYGGTDAGGNPTCIFTGVAVAGNPNSKFVLFVTVNDLSEQNRGLNPHAALNFFLYQQ
jgi:hypothetical protein